MWLGPAPNVPFDPFRCIYHFRWFWDYSGGQMTNWGAHDLDIARWALGARAPGGGRRLRRPVRAQDGGETPDVQEVLYHFPDASLGGGKGCVVSWTVREVGASKGEPLVFHGTKGSLAISRRGFKVTPDVWKADPKNETPATASVEEPGADIEVFDAAHIGALHRCRPFPEAAGGGRRGGTSHRGDVPPREHRDASRPQPALGRGEGGMRGRRGSERPAALRVSEAMDAVTGSGHHSFSSPG